MSMNTLTFGLDERPSLCPRYSDIRTTYLVRSLVTGMLYFKASHMGVGATRSILDAQGFPNRHAALAFAKELERTKRETLCRGSPPYTRIERKSERVDVQSEDSSSSSDLW